MFLSQSPHGLEIELEYLVFNTPHQRSLLRAFLPSIIVHSNLTIYISFSNSIWEREAVPGSTFPSHIFCLGGENTHAFRRSRSLPMKPSSKINFLIFTGSILMMVDVFAKPLGIPSLKNNWTLSECWSFRAHARNPASHSTRPLEWKTPNRLRGSSLRSG